MFPPPLEAPPVRRADGCHRRRATSSEELQGYIYSVGWIGGASETDVGRDFLSRIDRLPTVALGVEPLDQESLLLWRKHVAPKS